VLASAVTSIALAGPPGSVGGTVRLEPVKDAGRVARYGVRTKNPVLPPEAPRAIVYLERSDGNYPRTAPGEVSITQHGYQFRPAMVAVRVGGHVTFPNEDDEFHSVFSYSSPKRFDLGRFRKDEQSPPIALDEPGVVKVYCEIHKHMRALLLVVDTPWYTITDTSGRFAIADVPAGDYRVKAFLPNEKTLESNVTVNDGQAVEIELGR
jgi:plastocyanin